MELIRLNLPGRKGETYIAPPVPITEEKKEAILRKLCLIGWIAWNSLPVEERLKINAMMERLSIYRAQMEAAGDNVKTLSGLMIKMEKEFHIPALRSLSYEMKYCEVIDLYREIAHRRNLGGGEAGKTE
jgi:hypothetical protein